MVDVQRIYLFTRVTFNSCVKLRDGNGDKMGKVWIKSLKPWAGGGTSGSSISLDFSKVYLSGIYPGLTLS